jgi:hypothetical protein
MTFLRSSYSATCVSQNPFSRLSSIPRATASCAGEEQAKTMRVEAARVGVMRCSGPQSHPTRHPVAANDFPCEIDGLLVLALVRRTTSLQPIQR